VQLFCLIFAFFAAPAPQRSVLLPQKYGVIGFWYKVVAREKTQ